MAQVEVEVEAVSKAELMVAACMEGVAKQVGSAEGMLEAAAAVEAATVDTAVVARKRVRHRRSSRDTQQVRRGPCRVHSPTACQSSCNRPR